MSTAKRNVNGSSEEGSEVLTMGVLDSPRRLVSEIWLTVFDKLDKSDKPAFSRACPEWHDWMKGKRTQFLFQEVAPLLLEILPKHIFLKHRECCQIWMEIGDHHVQSPPSHHHLGIEERGVKTYDISDFANCFSAAEDVHTFMDEMKTHPGNPIPGRMLRLCWRKPRRLRWRHRGHLHRLCREYWRSLFILLQKFGTHVHHAYFNPMESARAGVVFYNILRCCLALLPNLRRLNIYEAWGASENEMMEYYRPGCLPQLENLETLDLKCMKVPLVETLLNSCCVPAKLKRLSHGLQFSDRNRLQLQHLINLEVLEGWLVIEELESIPNLPLRSLEVTIDADFGRLFNALVPFGETLTVLELNTSLVELEPAERSGFRLNLPNLKRLQIHEYTGSLDPFLELTSLNELIIPNYNANQEQAKYEVAQVSGFEHRMMESNIWSLMPSLRKLKLKWGRLTYERDPEAT